MHRGASIILIYSYSNLQMVILHHNNLLLPYNSNNNKRCMCKNWSFGSVFYTNIRFLG